MQRALRAVLLWVMVLAMPTQGMAASLMLLCGPSHARMVPVQLADAPPSATGMAAAGHDHAGAGHGAHGQASPEAPCADGHATPASAASPSGQAPHHDGFSCSACAACCHALALPASVVVAAAAGPVQLAPIASVEPVATHQPDGLDRPPRTAIA